LAVVCGDPLGREHQIEGSIDDSISKARDVIHEDYGTLKLDIDLEAMSASERSHAVTVLQRAVDRLSGPTQAANPSIVQ
jgi:hypothetical protein